MNQQWQQQQQQQQEQLRRMQQQQQENARHQQEEIRKRQEMGHWYQQQQEKEKLSSDSITGKFAQIKAEATKLSQDVKAGRLTGDQFKAKLRDLMFRDNNGTWWMLGAETLEWYSSHGKDWVRADPPVSPELKTEPPDSKQRVTVSPRHPPRILAVIVLLVCLGVTVGAGFGVGFIAYGLSNNNSLTLALTVLVWLVGVVLSIIVTRRMWRRRQPSSQLSN